MLGFHQITQVKYFITNDVVQLLRRVENGLKSLQQLYEAILVNEKIDTKKIKGVLTMKGQTISQTKLEIFMSKGRRNLVTLTFHPLEEIMDMFSAVTTMLEQINELNDSIEEFCEEEGTDQDTLADKSSYFADALIDIVHFLGCMRKDLKAAGDCVRLPRASRFPFCTRADCVARAELPPDVFLEFMIHRTQLIVNAYVFESAQVQSDALERDEVDFGTDLVGKLVLLEDQVVKITEHFSVPIAVLSSLDSALVVVDSAIYMCDHVRKNAEALLHCIRNLA